MKLVEDQGEVQELCLPQERHLAWGAGRLYPRSPPPRLEGGGRRSRGLEASSTGTPAGWGSAVHTASQGSPQAYISVSKALFLCYDVVIDYIFRREDEM